jgi:hypothetical protein
MGLLDEAIREHLELKRLRGAASSEIDRLEREALGPVRRGGDSVEQASVEAEPGLATADRADPDLSPGPSDRSRPIDPVEAGTAIYDVAAAEHTKGIEWEEHHPEPYAPDPPDIHISTPPSHLAPGEPGTSTEASTVGQETTEFDSRAAAAQRGFDMPVDEDPDVGASAPPDDDAAEIFAADEDATAVRPGPGQVHEGTEPPAPLPLEDEVPPGEEHPPDGEEGPVEDVLEETPDFLQQTPEHDRLWFEQRPPRDFDFDK